MAIIHYRMNPDKELPPEDRAHLDEVVKELEKAHRENWVDEYDEDCPPLTEKQLEKMAQIIRDRKKHA